MTPFGGVSKGKQLRRAYFFKQASGSGTTDDGGNTAIDCIDPRFLNVDHTKADMEIVPKVLYSNDKAGAL